jgi:hypothetical protein
MTDPIRDIERFRAMREALREAVLPRPEPLSLVRRARRLVSTRRQR